MGRPIKFKRSDFLPEVYDWISSGKTLRAYCRQPGKPSYGTVYDWVESDSSLLARAREKGHDAIAEECVQIADSKGDPNRDKLRVWTRLQLLKCWNPRKYGERVELAGQVEIKRVISDV